MPRGRFAIFALLLTAIASIGAAKSPEGMQVISNLPYVAGGDAAQVLDLYIPDEPASGLLPLIIYVHGGGWSAGTKLGGPCKWLARGGYIVASIEYRFSQNAKFPAQIEDCQAALRWLRASSDAYGIDPDHVGVIGSSAGGHLVALMGTTGAQPAFAAIGGNEKQSAAVQAVCDLYGPTDFTTVVAQAEKEPVANIFHFNSPSDPYSNLTGVPLADNAKNRAVSPVHYVTKNAPPFLILQGTADRLVPLAQSVELDAALRAAGVSCVLQKLPGAGHGGPQFDLPPVHALVLRFFDKHLKGVDAAIEPLPEADVSLPKKAATQP